MNKTPLHQFLTQNSSDAKRIRRQVWRIAIPVIIANSSVPLVAMVDTGVMGHLAHAYYIGAVALGSFLFSLILAAFGFLRMATTGFVAQAAGAEDHELVLVQCWRGLMVAVILGLVVVALTPFIIALAAQILTMSAEVEAGMAVYLRIVCLAAPAVTVNMVILGVLFGLQRIKATMLQLITINSINIIGNLVLVYGVGMRVEGVALATAAAHYCGLAVSLPLMVSALRAGAPLRLSSWGASWGASWREVFDLRALGRYLSLGLDLTIRTSCIILAELFVLNAASGIDDVALAASQVGFVIFGAIAYPLDGFAHAAEALTGTAIGRRDGVMFRHILRETLLLALAMAAAMAAVLALAGPLLISALTSIPEVVEVSHRILPILVVMPLVSVLAFQMDGVFVGATMGRDMRNAMLVSVAVFVPLVYVFQPWFGLIGIWLAFLLLLGLRGITLWWRIGHIRGLMASN